MAEEILIEISRLQREAYAKTYAKRAAEQRGELFSSPISDQTHPFWHISPSENTPQLD